MPKKYDYKKNTGSEQTRVRIMLSDEQFNQLEKIAKRHKISVDNLLDRYIKRCIADRAHP